jgi:hypothetical protein
MKHKLGILLEYKGKCLTYIKTQFYVPTTTANTTVYTCNATARAIIQTIQFANSTGTHKVTANVFSYANNTTIQIGVDDIAAKTCVNLALGPIILQERDALLLSSETTTDVRAIVSILEVNRGSLTN